jgi:hypothetical protein
LTSLGRPRQAAIESSHRPARTVGRRDCRSAACFLARAVCRGAEPSRHGGARASGALPAWFGVAGARACPASLPLPPWGKGGPKPAGDHAACDVTRQPALCLRRGPYLPTRTAGRPRDAIGPAGLGVPLGLARWQVVGPWAFPCLTTTSVFFVRIAGLSGSWAVGLSLSHDNVCLLRSDRGPNRIVIWVSAYCAIGRPLSEVTSCSWWSWPLSLPC